jgi:valyl-tRNA synthetase
MALESNYNPSEFESKIYKKWQELQIGNPDLQNVSKSETHSILMPPPNLTGDLHAGHAFQHFLMDTLSRYERINGKKNLWYPGVDHAGLQLEGVVDGLINKGEFDKQIESLVMGLDNASMLDIQKTLKSKDRSQLAILIKQALPSLWLDCAWQKVNLWRDNQKNQSAVLGDTPDYSRQLFTLDPRASKMVNVAFREYWEDSLIYKNSYLINWSVGLQTALSDVSGDTDFVTRKDPFINFYYKFQSLIPNIKLESDTAQLEQYFTQNPLLVATVRPETIHGDMGVAIHPEILKSKLIDFGISAPQVEQLISDLTAKDLTINFGIPELGVVGVQLIVSDKVDKDFGTGILKVTPASDLTDFNIWVNDFEGGKFVSSINKQGTLTESCGPYATQDRFQARLNIIYDLCKNGYVPLKEGFMTAPEFTTFNYTDYDKSSAVLREMLASYQIDFDYEHNVTICERSKTIVEPLISDEFFVGMTRKSVNTGLSLQEHGLEGISETNFFPNEYQERSRTFINSLKDWCISRNLVWGHQFPVWYNLANNPDKIFYSYQDSHNDPSIQSKMFIGDQEQLTEFIKQNNYPPSSWVQEEKRLDTWFSSSLWPLTTFGYSEYKNGEKINDFGTFYPTSTMVTAKEIFNIWICRMIILSKYFTSKLEKNDNKYNSLPFKDLIIHPTILDDQGKKMSKSLGNGMDPVKQISKYSSDSLRMAMMSGMIPGRNMRLGGNLADKLSEKYRNFGNKVWNIVRFLETKESFKTTLNKDFDPTISGWWLISKYKECVDRYERGFKNYELADALESLYDFVWNDLAAWHLEYIKVSDLDLPLTTYIVKDVIQLLTPFMPFESEVLWENITGESMASSHRNVEDMQYWYDQVTFRTKLIDGFEEVIKTVEGLRSVKGLFNIPAGDLVKFSSDNNAVIENFEYVKMIGKGELSNTEESVNWYQITNSSKADVITLIKDKEAEILRTNKQIETITKQKTTLESMLQSRDFVDNATPDIIKQKYDDLDSRNRDLLLLEKKLSLLK